MRVRQWHSVFLEPSVLSFAEDALSAEIQPLHRKRRLGGPCRDGCLVGGCKDSWRIGQHRAEDGLDLRFETRHPSVVADLANVAGYIVKGRSGPRMVVGAGADAHISHIVGLNVFKLREPVFQPARKHVLARELPILTTEDAGHSSERIAVLANTLVVASVSRVRFRRTMLTTRRKLVLVSLPLALVTAWALVLVSLSYKDSLHRWTADVAILTAAALLAALVGLPIALCQLFAVERDLARLALIPPRHFGQLP